MKPITILEMSQKVRSALDEVAGATSAEKQQGREMCA
jgi:hypothetical protein